jgi:2-hydroxy-6-oxonona-2,4-dienedioate hydrolase
MALTEEGLAPHPGIMSRYVKLASGAVAHYMTAGETGPAVVICHGGIPGSSGLAGARYQLTFLAEHGFRVYAPDFPGYGLADTRPDHYARLGPISHTLFLKEFVDALDLDKFHLTGNSMGCSNTWRFAISFPWRVLSWVLVAGNIPGYVDPSRIKRTIDVTAVNRSWFDGTTESMRKMIDPIIYRKEAITQDLLEMRTQAAIRQRESLAAYHAGSDAIAKDPNLAQVQVAKSRIEQLTHPRLLLWGANDVLNPVENAYLQEDVTPFMQYFYPTECGHQGQTDRPDLFNQVFLEFFRNGKLTRETAEAAGISKRRPELPGVVEESKVAV